MYSYVSRAELCISQSLLFALPLPLFSEKSGKGLPFAYSYVKNRVSFLPETKTALRGGFRALRARRGLTAYPLLKSEVFGW